MALSNNISDDVTDKNITNIINYDIRNRIWKLTNPFFIIKNKDFCLGALAANVPGDDKKSQIVYVTSILKLPFNNDLMQFEF